MFARISATSAAIVFIALVVIVSVFLMGMDSGAATAFWSPLSPLVGAAEDQPVIEPAEPLAEYRILIPFVSITGEVEGASWGTAP